MQFNELHLGTLDKNSNVCLICIGSQTIPIWPQLGRKCRSFLGKLTYFSPFLSQCEYYDQSQKRPFVLPKKQ